jgi:hypothetical protein
LRPGRPQDLQEWEEDDRDVQRVLALVAALHGPQPELGRELDEERPQSTQPKVASLAYHGPLTSMTASSTSEARVSGASR